MSGVYSTVQCAEELGSVSESDDLEGGIKATATVRVAWADRRALVQDVLLNHRPWPHQSVSGLRAFSCATQQVETEYVTDGQTCVVIDALVTINYSTQIKDLISEELEPTVEFQTLDHRRFRWGAANGPCLIEAEAPGRQLRGLNLSRTIYEVNPPLPTTLLTEFGKVNNAVYASALLGLTFGVETLLYHPPQLSRVYKSDGSRAFTVSLKFGYKPNTWNKFWRAETQLYSRIFDVGGAQYYNFPLGNFAAFLF